MRLMPRLMLALLAGAASITGSGAEAASFRQLYAFKGGADGAAPHAGLVFFNGLFYGTTTSGGGSANCQGGCGTIFSVNPVTGTEKVVYAFQGGAANDGANPVATLVPFDGMLWGTTPNGGSGGFAAPCNGGCGTVFSVDPATGNEHIAVSFGGAGMEGPVYGVQPYAGLTVYHGALYGTTLYGGGLRVGFGNGTVFSYTPSVTLGATRLVYTFGSSANDGAQPMGTLLNQDGTLFGTTTFGGVFGQGTVFAINPNTGKERVIHALAPGEGCFPANGLLSTSGILVGATTSCNLGVGALFSLKPSQRYAIFNVELYNESVPVGGMAALGGKVYIPALPGGDREDWGFVWNWTPPSIATYPTYTFQGGSDGADPYGSLIAWKGKIYGTAAAGGPYGAGTVFSILP